jgi:hypothetical protein
MQLTQGSVYGDDLGLYGVSRWSYLWADSSRVQPSNVYKRSLDHATLAVN